MCPIKMDHLYINPMLMNPTYMSPTYTPPQFTHPYTDVFTLHAPYSPPIQMDPSYSIPYNFHTPYTDGSTLLVPYTPRKLNSTTQMPSWVSPLMKLPERNLGPRFPFTTKYFTTYFDVFLNLILFFIKFYPQLYSFTLK